MADSVLKSSGMPELTDTQVLMICTAYEQGFGWGLEERLKSSNYTNPYGSPDHVLAWAWQHGYQEGLEARNQKPVWKKYPGELPEHNKKCLIKGPVKSARYSESSDTWFDANGQTVTVSEWMYIP